VAPESPVMVITGSSRGIGRGLAEQFLARGYRVAGCSRGPSTLEDPAYHHSQVDVGDESAVRTWVRALRSKYGRIDILVCNAGTAKAASLVTMTDGALLEEIVRSNVFGTFFVCREVARAMMVARTGRIVTVSSMAVGLHEEGTAAYAASKSAIVEMTKILAKELAPLGITANVIAPSMYASDAFAALGEAVQQRARERLTIQRTVTIEEIANVVAFYAAPDSSVITGQVIHMGLVV
jgi:3-oxoacyl-[acyl-carrier protein] reductase